MDSRLDPVISISLVTCSGPILHNLVLMYLPCLFLISFFSKKKEEGQENKLEISTPSFSCNSIPFIKTRDHPIFPAASNTGSIKMVLGSVSTLGRSATYIITRITVCIKCQFLIKLAFHCSSFLSSFLHFVSYHFPILFLFIRRKKKEDIRKKQGMKFRSIYLYISCVFSFYFLLRKYGKHDII